MINKQGDHDRHLELCVADGQPIGFYHAKVDHLGHKGYIKPEYGFIMEFYIIPEQRRKGLGCFMYQRMISHLMNHGVKKIYLTTDPVTGKPFWEKLGFISNGEMSPDNDQEILEAKISNFPV